MIPDLARLPEMPAFVRQRQREQRAEAPGEDRQHRRTMAGPAQVHAVRPLQPDVDLFLPVEESRDDLVAGKRGRWDKALEGSRPYAGRRLLGVHEPPLEQRIAEWAGAEQSLLPC